MSQLPQEHTRQKPIECASMTKAIIHIETKATKMQTIYKILDNAVKAIQTNQPTIKAYWDGDEIQ
jgi:hypothetical protein